MWRGLFWRSGKRASERGVCIAPGYTSSPLREEDDPATNDTTSRQANSALSRSPPLRPERVTVGEPPHQGHVLAPEILLCRKRIVRPAPDLEIVERRRSAERVRMPVMNLEPTGFATSLAAVVPVSALLAVALEHGATHGRRNVARTTPRRRGIGGYLADPRRRG